MNVDIAMPILFVAVPVALCLVSVAVAAFVWAVREGQMDDLDTPAHRMLHDDDDDVPPSPLQRRE